jgi:ankyrin repeat protein
MGKQSSFSAAAYGGQREIVKLLLDRGADVNAVKNGGGDRGETALHYATRSGANSAAEGRYQCAK